MAKKVQIKVLGFGEMSRKEKRLLERTLIDLTGKGLSAFDYDEDTGVADDVPVMAFEDCLMFVSARRHANHVDMTWDEFDDMTDIEFVARPEPKGKAAPKGRSKSSRKGTTSNS